MMMCWQIRAKSDSSSVNIPWPSGGFGDGDYIYAFQKIIMPIAYEFNPDLVISELLAIACRNFQAHTSLRWIRRCRWRPPGWLPRHSARLWAHDAYAVCSGRRQSCRRPRGELLARL